MTTITISNDEVILSCEFGYRSTLDDMVDQFCLLMEGAGWHRDAINSAIAKKAEDDRTTDTVQEDQGA